jgi:REP element-mobilizing transposase RayT
MVRALGRRRGQRNLLFEDDADRGRFLEGLGERVELYEIRLYAFSLMDNHAHLVLETPRANCSAFMQALSTAYTVYFNLRHDRHGHLLDGRFKARLVQRDDYLLALSRYVHLNPVKTAKTKNRPMEERLHLLREYRWSTYPSYIGLTRPDEFVEYGPLLAQMGGRKDERAERYRRFVESGMAEDDLEFEASLKLSPRAIGDEDFRAWVDGLYEDAIRDRERSEDVSFRRPLQPLPADTVLRVLGESLGTPVAEFRERKRNSPLRAVAARFLCRYAGVTQRQAAEELGVRTGSAISHQIKKVDRLLQDDDRLRRAVKRASRRLENLREERQERGGRANR